jgi:hypothetical protein
MNAEIETAENLRRLLLQRIKERLPQLDNS